MSDTLAIAILSPAPLPAVDDLGWGVHAQASALARRGHRVTVLVPGTTRVELVEGRAVLAAAEAGDADALTAVPGAPRVVRVGRAIRAGRQRHVSGPLDLAAGLEGALRYGAFDVVHLHDPLAPSPALAALRHTGAAAVGTFHRPLAGVAFLGPLVQRAVGRIDVRLADTAPVLRAVNQVLPGDYAVLVPGADPLEPTRGTGVAVVARGRDSAGLRFGLGVLRALAPALTGPLTLMGPREAPWRVRAAIPKALRTRVTVVEGAGPDAWGRLLADAAVVLLATPEDVAGPVARMAMAGGRAIIAPRCAEADELLNHGQDALVLPPFTRPAWVDAVRQLIDDPARRAQLGLAATAAVATHDEVAAQLEVHYRDAIARHGRRRSEPGARVVADLRVRPMPGGDPAWLAAACVEAGLDVVAVAAPGGLEAARAVAAAAPPDLTVIIGQEITTAQGVIVGLFLTQPVADGLELPEAAHRVRAQGGVVVVPHPDTAAAPPPHVVRDNAAVIDAHEVVVTPDALDGAAAAQRLGMVITAASVTPTPEVLGAVGMVMRPFEDGRDFVAALADATLTRPRRARRTRRGRQRATRAT